MKKKVGRTSKDGITLEKDQKSEYKRFCSFFLIFFAVALLLELTLFNYKFYMTMGNESFHVDYAADDNLTELDQIPSFAEAAYTVTGEENAVLHLEPVGTKINSLRVDIGYQETDLPNEIRGNEAAYYDWHHSKKIKMSLTVNDEANELGAYYGHREIVHDVEPSTYMTVHASGASDWLELNLELEQGRVLYIYGIEINPVIPFRFSLFRVFAVFFLLSLIHVFRPRSILYRIKFRSGCKWQIAVTAAVIVLEVIVGAGIVSLNPHYLYPTHTTSREYYELAEAFHQKQFHLDIEVPEYLLEMDNPYDTGLRGMLRDENNSSYLWDYSFYNGKYYCYFGVVPELLFYYPYYELFGTGNGGGELPHYKVVFFCSMMTILAAFFLVRQFIRLWYPETSFLLYLFLSAALSLGCESLTYLAQAVSYVVPIACGVMFSMWGLYFWLSAKKNDTPDGLRGWRLAAGSCCMALVAGCRPQLLLMSFLVFPIFWQEMRNRALWKGKNLIKVIGFCLPYIVVAAGLMYYNAARFGSPFDFGANYNLTTNDMTKRGFELGRIGIGLFTYLFQPMKLTADFPFVQSCDFTSRYVGVTIYERTFGGIFMTGIMLLPLLLLPWAVRCLKDKKQGCRFCLLSVMAAVLIVVADTEMAGVLARYYIDFSWILYMAVVPVLFTVYEYCSNHKDEFRMQLFRSFLVLAAVSGISYQLCRIYAWHPNDAAASLMYANPVKFYEMAYRIAFWL